MSYRSAADEQGTASCRTLRRTSLRKPARGNFLTFTQMLNNCQWRQHQKVAYGEEEERGTDGSSSKYEKSNDLKRIVAGWLL